MVASQEKNEKIKPSSMTCIKDFHKDVTQLLQEDLTPPQFSLHQTQPGNYLADSCINPPDQIFAFTVLKDVD